MRFNGLNRAEVIELANALWWSWADGHARNPKTAERLERELRELGYKLGNYNAVATSVRRTLRRKAAQR